ncbi:WD40 repeat domain-containing protein [Sorangium cellulosum]|uniref:WD40 repeat domain-containing protein n=1 Tax=Sorangium cellulosum TaxID=56 RepID=UPI0012FF6B5E|nr:hypothetical protein [Sorangium cellulosum]
MTDVEIGSPVRCVRFDASGRYLAVLPASTNNVAVFELDGTMLRPRGCLPTAISVDVPIATLAFHPRDPIVALASQDRLLGLWDVARATAVAALGELQQAHPARERGYWGVSFSADGKFVESHSMERGLGERFDWSTGQRTSTRFGPGGPIALHSEGRILAVCSVAEMATTTWFAEWLASGVRWYSAELVCWFPATRVVFGPGAVAFIGGSGATAVQVHDFPSCDVRFVVDLDPNPGDVEFPWGVSEALAFTPGGERIFAPSASGEVLALDASTGARLAAWQAHASLVTTLDVHPHAPLVVSGGADGAVALAHEPGLAWTRRATPGEQDAFIARFAPLPGDEPNRGPCTVIEP